MKTVNKFLHESAVLIVTPIIKKFRMMRQDYDVCPHCNQEIGEKSIYMNTDNYVFHRPCMDKGPIDKMQAMSQERINQMWGWENKKDEHKESGHA